MKNVLALSVALALVGSSQLAAQQNSAQSRTQPTRPTAARTTPIGALESNLASSKTMIDAVSKSANGNCVQNSCGCDSSCGSSCCNGKNGCGCSCFSAGAYAGVEATYLVASPTQNRMFFNNSSGGLDDDAPFQYEFSAAPRVWFGYQNANGVGVRARYWDYETSANEIFIDDINTNSNDLDGGVFGSQFDAYTLDVELTKKFRRRCWDLTGAVGARYASITHRYRGQELDINDASVDDNDMFVLDRRIQGIGITGAIEGRRQIACSNLAAFWSARGSAIRGANRAYSLDVEVDDGDADISTHGVDSDDTTYIGDLQLGLEWNSRIQCLGGANVFVRSAFEYQIWDFARRPLASTTDDDNIFVDSLGWGDMNFYGFAVSAGISR